MSKKNIPLLIILLIIPFIITTACMPFLSDTIPTHYDINGVVDGYGSKYTYFLIPCLFSSGIIFIITLSLIKIKASHTDKEQHQSIVNANTILNIGITLSICEIIFTSCFMYNAYCYSQSATNSSQISISKMIIIVMGLLIVQAGNLCPKTRINNIVGIKTPWSMTNDKTWAMTNRIGGRIILVSGLVTIILGIVLKDSYVMIAFLIVLLIVTVSVSIVSFIAYKKYGNDL